MKPRVPNQVTAAPLTTTLKGDISKKALTPLRLLDFGCSIDTIHKSLRRRTSRSSRTHLTSLTLATLSQISRQQPHGWAMAALQLDWNGTLGASKAVTVTGEYKRF